MTAPAPVQACTRRCRPAASVHGQDPRRGRAVAARIGIAALLIAAAPALAQGASAPTAGGQPGQPPAALPVAQWSATAWLGVCLYVAVFLAAAWGIYRLADLRDQEPPA